MTQAHDRAHGDLISEVADPPRDSGRSPRNSRRPPRSAVRARLSVILLFVIMGMTVGNWQSRLPYIRRAVGIGDAAWGLASTAAIVGELASLVVLSMLISRVTARRLSLVAATLILLVTAPLAASSTVVALIPGLFVWGFAANLLSTPVNAQAIEVERRYGSPLMSTFHASYSVGMLAGGGIGILAAAIGLAPVVQMAVCNAALGALLLATWRWQPEAEKQAPQPLQRSRGSRRFTPQLLLLASIALLIAFTESASAQWSALYATQALSASAAVGAATYASLSTATVTMRLGGDRVMARIGRTRFIKASAIAAAAGLGLALAIGTPAAALIGFAVLGAGTACVYPTIVGIAGKQPGMESAEGVWVMETGQQPGFFMAPVLIGLLAGAFGLRAALVAVVVATLGVAALSGRVTERPQAAS
jgi:hypothetical protein